MDFLNFLTHLYRDPNWTELGDGSRGSLQQAQENFVEQRTPDSLQINSNASARVAQDFQRQYGAPGQNTQAWTALQGLSNAAVADRNSALQRIRAANGVGNEATRAASIEEILAVNDRVMGSAFLITQAALNETPPNAERLQSALAAYNQALEGYTANLNALGNHGPTSAMLPTATLVNAYSYVIRPTLALINLLQSRLDQTMHANPAVSGQMRGLTEKIRNVWALMANVVHSNGADMQSYQFLREFALGQADLLSLGLDENHEHADLLESARGHLTQAFTLSQGIQNPEGDLANFHQVVQVYSVRQVNTLPPLPSAAQAARHLVTSNTLAFLSTVCQEIDALHRTAPEVMAERYTRFQLVVDALLATAPELNLRQAMERLQNLRWNDELYNHMQRWIARENVAHPDQRVSYEQVLEALANPSANATLRTAALAQIQDFKSRNARNTLHQNISVDNLNDRENGALTLLRGSKTLHQMLPMLASALHGSLAQMPAQSADRRILLDFFRSTSEGHDESRTHLELGKQEILMALLNDRVPSEEALNRFRASGSQAREFVNHLIDFVRNRSAERNHLQENNPRVRHLRVDPSLPNADQLNQSLQAIAMNEIPRGTPAHIRNRSLPDWLTRLQGAAYTEPQRTSAEQNDQRIIQDLESLSRDLERGALFSETDSSPRNYRRAYGSLIAFVSMAGANGGVHNADGSRRATDLEHVQGILRSDRHGLLDDSSDLPNELLDLDASAAPANASGNLGELGSAWAERVLNLIDRHNSGGNAWLENAVHDNERHPASFRVIWNTLAGDARQAGSFAHQLGSYHLPQAGLSRNVQAIAQERARTTHPVRDTLMAVATVENLALTGVMAGSAQWANRAIQGSEAVASGARVTLTEFLLASSQRLTQLRGFGRVGLLAWPILRTGAAVTNWAGRNPTMAAAALSGLGGYEMASVRDQHWRVYNNAHPDDRHEFDLYEDWARNSALLFAVASPVWYPSYFNSTRNVRIWGYDQTQWRILAPATWAPRTRVASTMIASLMVGAGVDHFRPHHSHWENFAYGGLGTLAVLSPIALSASNRAVLAVESGLGSFSSGAMRMGTVAENGQLGFSGHMIVGATSGLAGGTVASGLGFLRDGANGYDTHFWGDMAQSSTSLGIAMTANSAVGTLISLPGRGLQRYRERNMTPIQVSDARLAQAQRDVQAMMNRSVAMQRITGLGHALAGALVATGGMLATDAEMRALHDNRLLPNRSDFSFSAEEVASTYINMLAFEGMNGAMSRFRTRNLLGRTRATQIDHITDRLLQGVSFADANVGRRARDFVWNRLALEAVRGRDLSQIAREENIRQWQANYTAGQTRLRSWEFSRTGEGVQLADRGASPTAIAEAHLPQALLNTLASQALVHAGEATPPDVRIYIHKTDGTVLGEAPAEADRPQYEAVQIGFSGGRVYLSPETQAQLNRMVASRPVADPVVPVIQEIAARHGALIALDAASVTLAGLIRGIRSEHLQGSTSLYVTETENANRAYTSAETVQEALNRETSKEPSARNENLLRRLQEQMGLFLSRRLVARVQVDGESYDIYRSAAASSGPGESRIRQPLENVPEDRRGRHLLFEITLPGETRPNGLLGRWRARPSEEPIRILSRSGNGQWAALPEGWRNLLSRYEQNAQSGQPIRMQGEVVGTGVSPSTIAAGLLVDPEQVLHVGDSRRINNESFNDPYGAMIPEEFEMALERRSDTEWVLHNYSLRDGMDIGVNGSVIARNGERVVNDGDVLRIPAGEAGGHPRFIEIQLNLHSANLRPLPADHANAAQVLNSAATMPLLNGVRLSNPRGNSLRITAIQSPVRIGTFDASDAAVGSDVELAAGSSPRDFNISNNHHLKITFTDEHGNPVTIRYNARSTRPAPAAHAASVDAANTHELGSLSAPLSREGAAIEAIPGAPNRLRVRAVDSDVRAGSQVIPAGEEREIDLAVGNNLDITYTKADGTAETLRLTNPRVARPVPAAHAASASATHELSGLSAPLELEGARLTRLSDTRVRIEALDSGVRVNDIEIAAGSSQEIDLHAGEAVDISYTKVDGTADTIALNGIPLRPTTLNVVAPGDGAIARAHASVKLSFTRGTPHIAILPEIADGATVLVDASSHPDLAAHIGAGESIAIHRDGADYFVSVRGTSDDYEGDPIDPRTTYNIGSQDFRITLPSPAPVLRPAPGAHAAPRVSHGMADGTFSAVLEGGQVEQIASNRIRVTAEESSLRVGDETVAAGSSREFELNAGQVLNISATKADGSSIDTVEVRRAEEVRFWRDGNQAILSDGTRIPLPGASPSGLATVQAVREHYRGLRGDAVDDPNFFRFAPAEASQPLPDHITTTAAVQLIADIGSLRHSGAPYLIVEVRTDAHGNAVGFENRRTAIDANDALADNEVRLYISGTELHRESSGSLAGVNAGSREALNRVFPEVTVLDDPTILVNLPPALVNARTRLSQQLEASPHERYVLIEATVDADGHVTELRRIATDSDDKSLRPAANQWVIDTVQGTSRVREGNLSGIHAKDREGLHGLFPEDNGDPTRTIPRAVAERINQISQIQFLLPATIASGERFLISSTGVPTNPFAVANTQGSNLADVRSIGIVDVADTGLTIYTSRDEHDIELSIARAALTAQYNRPIRVLRETPPRLEPPSGGGGGSPGGASFSSDPAAPADRAAGVAGAGAGAPARLASHPELYLSTSMFGSFSLAALYPGEAGLPPLEFRGGIHEGRRYVEVRSAGGAGAAHFIHPLSVEPASGVRDDWRTLGWSGDEIRLRFMDGSGAERELNLHLNDSFTEARPAAPAAARPSSGASFAIQRGQRVSVAAIVGMTHPNSQLHRAEIRLNDRGNYFYLETGENTHLLEVQREGQAPQHVGENGSHRLGPPGTSITIFETDNYGHREEYRIVLPTPTEPPPPPRRAEPPTAEPPSPPAEQTPTPSAPSNDPIAAGTGPQGEAVTAAKPGEPTDEELAAYFAETPAPAEAAPRPRPAGFEGWGFFRRGAEWLRERIPALLERTPIGAIINTSGNSSPGSAHPIPAEQLPQTPEAVDSYLRRLRNDPAYLQARERRLIPEMMDGPHAAFTRPTRAVQVNGYTFFLSGIIRSNSRDYVLGMVPVVENGNIVLKRRIFYKSRSDGAGWRCPPYSTNGHLYKGAHYVASTQAVPELAEALDRIAAERPSRPSDPEAPDFENDDLGNEELLNYLELVNPLQRYTADPNRDAIAGTNLGSVLGRHEAEEAVQVTLLEELSAFQPGHVFSENNPRITKQTGYGQLLDPAAVEAQVRDILSLNSRYPDGFIPDFTLPALTTRNTQHPLLGPVMLQDFAATLQTPRGPRPLVWTMARDTRNRTWCANIRYADAPMNSYGVPSEIFEGGILISKPLEYWHQASGLPDRYREEVIDPATGRTDTGYVDITRFLHELEPIRRYRIALGLESGRPIMSSHASNTMRPVTQDTILIQRPEAEALRQEPPPPGPETAPAPVDASHSAPPSPPPRPVHPAIVLGDFGSNRIQLVLYPNSQDPQSLREENVVKIAFSDGSIPSPVRLGQIRKNGGTWRLFPDAVAGMEVRSRSGDIKRAAEDNGQRPIDLRAGDRISVGSHVLEFDGDQFTPESDAAPQVLRAAEPMPAPVATAARNYPLQAIQVPEDFRGMLRTLIPSLPADSALGRLMVRRMGKSSSYRIMAHNQELMLQRPGAPAETIRENGVLGEIGDQVELRLGNETATLVLDDAQGSAALIPRVQLLINGTAVELRFGPSSPERLIGRAQQEAPYAPYSQISRIHMSLRVGRHPSGELGYFLTYQGGNPSVFRAQGYEAPLQRGTPIFLVPGAYAIDTPSTDSSVPAVRTELHLPAIDPRLNFPEWNLPPAPEPVAPPPPQAWQPPPVSTPASISHPVYDYADLPFWDTPFPGVQECLVGRARSDVVDLGSRVVARYQARLIRSGNQYFIEDLSNDPRRQSSRQVCDDRGTYLTVNTPRGQVWHYLPPMDAQQQALRAPLANGSILGFGSPHQIVDMRYSGSDETSMEFYRFEVEADGRARLVRLVSGTVEIPHQVEVWGQNARAAAVPAVRYSNDAHPQLLLPGNSVVDLPVPPNHFLVLGRGNDFANIHLSNITGVSRGQATLARFDRNGDIHYILVDGFFDRQTGAQHQSSNGTYIQRNGHVIQVPADGNAGVALQAGDVIHVGDPRSDEGSILSIPWMAPHHSAAQTGQPNGAGRH